MVSPSPPSYSWGHIMSSLPVPVIINIHNYNSQDSTVLRQGGDAHILLDDGISHRRSPANDAYLSTRDFRPQLSRATERRVEARLQVRQTLTELSTCSQGTVPQVDSVASLAIKILSLVEVCRPNIAESNISQSKHASTAQRCLR